MTVLAVCGWMLCGLAGLACLELRRRLELVAQAEHELRGPLTALLLGVEDMRVDRPPRHGTDSAPLPARDLAGIEAQLGRVRLSLDDLTAARAGRRAPPRREQLALEGAVRASAAGWEAPARHAGGRVSLDWRAGPVTLDADGRRVAQAIGNVLSNAVEHGGADVRVSGRRTSTGVRIEVCDGGPGFAGSPAPDRAAGHGRGLRIAARAVREAGGRLRVESGGEGATVALDLPASER